MVPAEHLIEEEVQKVRLKNIHLANALKKLEATIRYLHSLVAIKPGVVAALLLIACTLLTTSPSNS